MNKAGSLLIMKLVQLKAFVFLPGFTQEKEKKSAVWLLPIDCAGSM